MRFRFLSIIFYTAISISAIFSNVTNAALIDRGNGMIYDDTLDITWLQDANFAMTSGFDPTGLMKWDTSMDWAANLSFGGHNDWRLFNADPSCGTLNYNCTKSELGHLFYNDFGIAAGESILTATGLGLQNFNLFVNVSSTRVYMSGTSFSSTGAYDFRTRNGLQSISNKVGLDYAWAVHDGDIGKIPEPSTLAIFALGLMGLISRSFKNIPAVHLLKLEYCSLSRCQPLT